MDSAELVEMVEDRYAEIDNVRQVGERAAFVAGVSTVVGEFEADAVLVGGNLEVDLAVYVSEAVASGSDLIVAIGAIPAAFNSMEAPHLETLMEAIEHGG